MCKGSVLFEVNRHSQSTRGVGFLGWKQLVRQLVFSSWLSGKLNHDNGLKSNLLTHRK